MPYNNTYLSNLDKERKRFSKIELSLVDDAEKSLRIADKEIETLKSLISVFEDVQNEYNDAVAQISEFVKESTVDMDAANDLADEMILQKLEFVTSADALGINVKEIPVANELEEKSDELINLVSDIEQVIDEAKKLI